MASPKIKIEADVSGVESALNRVNDLAKDIKQSLSAGKLNIDSDGASRTLRDLSKAATAVSVSLDNARQAGVDLSKVDFQRVASSLDSAASAASQLEDSLGSADSISTGISRAAGDVRGLEVALDRVSRAHDGAGRDGVAAAKNAANEHKRLEDQLNRVRRSQEILSREGVRLSREQAEQAKKTFEAWRSSGARGTHKLKGVEFDDWLDSGWRSFSVDEREARARRDSVLRSLGVVSPQASNDSSFESRAFGIGVRGVASALPNGGIGGAIMGEAVQHARNSEGGLFSSSGLMTLGKGAGIGALAYGAYKVVSGVANKYDDAKTELIQYSELRRSLGLTVKDFEQLRASVVGVSKDLGLTNNEMASLARNYAKGAALSDGAFDIGGSVRTGAQMSRGLGVDASVGVGFLANMKHYGLVSDDADNRKMALMIGEAVNKGGMQSRVDELLGAVSDFSANAARGSLSAPDAAGYAAMLASMSGLGLVGWKGDPRAAAMAFGQADSAFRSGGGFGEASQNFLLSVFQRRFSGFTALDQSALQEQGLLGSASSAFGRDSAAYRFAQSRGDVAQMARYEKWASEGGNSPMIDMVMSDLEKRHGGDSRAMQMELSGLFGMSSTNAQAFYLAYKSNGGAAGLMSSLSKNGIDASQFDMTKLGALAGLANAKRPELLSQGRYLMGLGMMDGDRDALRNSMLSGSDDELRKVITRLSGKYDTGKDTGEKALELQAQISNELQDMASALVPAANTIKDAIVSLVRFVAPDSEFAKAYKDDKAGAWRSSGYGYSELPSDPTDPRSDVPLPIVPVGQPSLHRQGLVDRLSSDKSVVKRKIENAARIKGIPPEVALALAEVESGFKHDALGSVINNPKSMHYGDRAAGVFQFMQKTAPHINRLDADQNIDFATSELKRLHKKFGRWDLAVAAWHAGENHPEIKAGRVPSNSSDGHMRTGDYVGAVLGKSKIYAKEITKRESFGQIDVGRLSDGVAPKSSFGGSQDVRVSGSAEGRVVVVNEKGQEVGSTSLDFSFNGGRPVPAGVR